MLFRRVRLLFITKNWMNGIERNTYYLTEALKKRMVVEVWEEPGDINDILATIHFKPDFILLNDIRPTRCPEITGLKDCPIPFGIIMHDLHYQMEARKQFVEQNNVQYIFTHYRDAFLSGYPEYKDRMIWLPHFVNIDVFKDYQLPKTLDFLMMGVVLESVYPLRDRILQQLREDPHFTYHPHPGYLHESYDENQFLVGTRYAKEINQSKIFFTCDSIYHYPLMKYYEVLACNTLLLAPSSAELFDLGFVPGVHYIDINEENFIEKAFYYLQNYQTKGKAIAKNGYKMVRKKHSVTVRAKQLEKQFKKIIAKQKEEKRK
ncbi:glycosyltransferase [Neobacillus sp. OS1-2]|uniref:glycosyltransferase n=1 Tax=Neobacillus sp. OS1-2 TaxID=3070680 RepID=UPI0027E16729|nr:glycosyltransferase [Neobacillus sp. OS1-2]WML39500.1 glycosyltransferase [Neobacillus sp. OS1-2]